MDNMERAIESAWDLESLAATYVDHHSEWTPEHTLAAMTRLVGILATERMIAEENHYRDDF